jgi:outer membrane protein OmpA-like peptidoglycan-associated protein
VSQQRLKQHHKSTRLPLRLMMGLALSLIAFPIQAQLAVSTDDIVQALQPKPRPRTRGLAAPVLSPSDTTILDKARHTTRGLSVQERTDLANVVAKSAMPAMDFEITFSLDSAALTEPAKATLAKLGEALRRPELVSMTFLVAGHTDASGTAPHNLALSQQRANAVKTFLMAGYGISQDRLVAVGYGQEQLKNSDAPLAGENRRVKIVNMGAN